MRFRHIIWICLLPAICLAQQQPKTAAKKPPVLHSQFYPAEELKVTPGGNFKMTPVFDGVTTRGELLELHMSELGPGQTPNPLHPHVNEEILVIREGTLDVTINDQTKRMGPGSVAYVQSNDKIGIKLVGTTPAKYIIISVGDR
jgi:XRE family transcriptional regulator, regulator of sulfur utilization